MILAHVLEIMITGSISFSAKDRSWHVYTNCLKLIEVNRCYI